ncbi:hypothetical protein R3P38DRAFT_2798736 [Favolaschia claudopus]|uniref:Uncharacterized protein n=1 Tax=Favolaschia claudopus TaxID=2862362 RepID=A0AAW0A1K0_9AGAR
MQRGNWNSGKENAADVVVASDTFTVQTALANENDTKAEAHDVHLLLRGTCIRIAVIFDLTKDMVNWLMLREDDCSRRNSGRSKIGYMLVREVTRPSSSQISNAVAETRRIVPLTAPHTTAQRGGIAASKRSGAAKLSKISLRPPLHRRFLPHQCRVQLIFNIDQHKVQQWLQLAFFTIDTSLYTYKNMRYMLVMFRRTALRAAEAPQDRRANLMRRNNFAPQAAFHFSRLIHHACGWLCLG